MSTYLGIDFGTKRIGLAIAESEVKLARPLATVTAQELPVIVKRHGPFEAVVVGLPRGLDGQDTPQTLTVQRLADDLLGPLKLDPIYQDEAATSAIAEEQLKASGKPYTKADIDAEAATIILQDYLDTL
jgi:putative holliday junction resolvase